VSSSLARLSTNTKDLLTLSSWSPGSLTIETTLHKNAILFVRGNISQDVKQGMDKEQMSIAILGSGKKSTFSNTVIQKL
jgi:hypothetical protein